MAPIGYTRTLPSARAFSTIARVIPAVSLTGLVLGIAHTAVKPPAAAARVPVAIVSLSSRPGSRRCVCRSMKPGHTTRPLASTTLGAARLQPAAPTSRDDAVLDQHVERRVEPLRGVDDAAALEQQPAHDAASALPPSSR